ncbi:MAG: hypothetical protein Q8P67_17190 [archaeon]|nr:hypothetical protein [archaeon]
MALAGALCDRRLPSSLSSHRLLLASPPAEDRLADRCRAPSSQSLCRCSLKERRAGMRLLPPHSSRSQQDSAASTEMNSSHAMMGCSGAPLTSGRLLSSQYRACAWSRPSPAVTLPSGVLRTLLALITSLILIPPFCSVGDFMASTMYSGPPPALFRAGLINDSLNVGLNE